MALPEITPQSIFPDYPRHEQIVNKDGKLNPYWDLGLSSLFQALQKNFKNEGILFPPLTIDQINKIQAIYTPYLNMPLPFRNPAIPDISGQTIFDSTNRVPKIFIITYDNSFMPPKILTAQWHEIQIS